MKKIIFPYIFNDSNTFYEDVSLKYYNLDDNENDRNVLLIEQIKDNRQNIDRVINLLKGNIVFIGYLEKTDYYKLVKTMEFNDLISFENDNEIEPIHLKKVIENIEQGNNVSKIWLSKYLLSDDEINKVIYIYNSYISLEENEIVTVDNTLERIKLRYKDIQEYKNEEKDYFSVDPITVQEFNELETIIVNMIERKI